MKQLTEEQLVKHSANMKLTKSSKLDAFLTRYFEETKRDLATHIDLTLFKNISFTCGVPLLVVDLFSYLTGQPEQVKSAMKLLHERVEPKRIHHYRNSAEESESPSPTTKRSQREQARQNSYRMIPPLKDHPEEIASSESEEDDSY